MSSSDKSSREEQLGKAAEVFRAIGKPVLDAITVVLPFVVEYSQKAYEMWIKLPFNVVQIIIGLIFCFFGGLYPTLFTVIQAIKAGGFSTLSEAIMDLYEEVMVVLEASKKDDEVDQDKDGKADVKQIDNKALLVRKASMVMTKINPQKVSKRSVVRQRTKRNKKRPPTHRSPCLLLFYFVSLSGGQSISFRLQNLGGRYCYGDHSICTDHCIGYYHFGRFA
jgi:phosphoribosylanthranilate isomerase